MSGALLKIKRHKLESIIALCLMLFAISNVIVGYYYGLGLSIITISVILYRILKD